MMGTLMPLASISFIVHPDITTIHFDVIRFAVAVAVRGMTSSNVLKFLKALQGEVSTFLGVGGSWGSWRSWGSMDFSWGFIIHREYGTSRGKIHERVHTMNWSIP